MEIYCIYPWASIVASVLSLTGICEIRSTREQKRRINAFSNMLFVASSPRPYRSVGRRSPMGSEPTGLQSAWKVFDMANISVFPLADKFSAA